MLKDSAQCCSMIPQEPTILTPFEAENIPRDGYSIANSIRFDSRPCYKVMKRLISDHWKQRNGKKIYIHKKKKIILIVTHSTEKIINKSTFELQAIN